MPWALVPCEHGIPTQSPRRRRRVQPSAQVVRVRLSLVLLPKPNNDGNCPPRVGRCPAVAKERGMGAEP